MRRVFEKLVGQEQLKEILGKDIEASSVSHAYIIEGTEGSGKHTLAIQLAAAVSCMRRDVGHSALPCGECKSCKKILGGKSPDVITVGRDGKTSIGVEAVRFITSDIAIYPNDSDTKVYIIEDADTMTVQAQNALLLTLEEPPSYAIIILLCENSRTLLETVRSRAPILRTQAVDGQKMLEYLVANNHTAAEMQKNSLHNLKEIINASNGSIGRAIKLLDPKTAEQILSMRNASVSFLSAVAEKNAAKIFTELNSFGSKRDEVSEKLDLLFPIMRDLILLKKNEASPLCFFTDREQGLELAERFTTPGLMKLYDAVLNAFEKIAQRNANIRLALCEMALNAEII